MELYEAGDFFIVQDRNHGLWCNRKTGHLEARPGEDLCEASNPICLGVVYGVIGKIQILPDTEWRLVLIKQQECVGKYLLKHDVYKVSRVAILPLSMTAVPDSFDIAHCKKHHFGIRKPKQITKQSKQIFQSTLNSIRSVKESVQYKKSPRDPQKEQEKLEKRLLEEVVKMLNVSDFYYYSPTGDITNTVQRQNLPSYRKNDVLWRRCDERFFWNRSLLTDLIDSQNPLADHWIQPLIQGYFDAQSCHMMETDFYQQSSFHQDVYDFSLSVLSRRSRHRAGTRYRRRGVDEDGHCANYVETEQILIFREHTVAFVQVRGSIPVYWSQPGHKYRPPPILEKDENETRVAFQKHFEQQLHLYKHMTCLSLVDRQGREKVMADAFLHHIVLMNSPELAYVAFDFHEYCRGMQFDNVVMLTDAVKDMLKSYKYCWVDSQGMICEQEGAFRVNCIDCLDRTNVVQTAIARIIIDQQVRKLGLLTPDNELPEMIRQTFNQLWANNGDAISRQYAGTAAMKGDYTRTGERKFSGMMKDGVKSANRYLIHRFKDLYRQAAIDIQLGQPLEPDVLSALTRSQLGAENQLDEIDYIREKASDVVTVIDECRKLLIMEPENSLGGWGVISLDNENGGSGGISDEMDIILLLTDANCYVVNYDDELDCLTDYQRISLADLYAIDVGPTGNSVFRSKQQCIRLWYKYHGDPGYFHTFRIPNVRAFNNTVIEIKSEEEAKEILRAMAENFKVASDISRNVLNIREVKVEQKRFRPVSRTSIHGSSLESGVWNNSQKIANMATSAVNKAASNVKKQLGNQLKKLQSPVRRPSHQTCHTNHAHSLGDDEDDLERYDDFSDPSDRVSNGDGHVSSSDTSSEHIDEMRVLKTTAITVGSLPDLSTTPTNGCLMDVNQEMNYGRLARSSPHIVVDDAASVDTPSVSSLAGQTHHSTAPCLQSLENCNQDQTTSASELQLPSSDTAQNHGWKISFSDDALKNYTIVMSDGITNKSPLSKIRSGLSQVSQLIVNQSTSPRSRRRRQVLEAQLLDNHMKSHEQFKYCKTKIILL